MGGIGSGWGYGVSVGDTGSVRGIRSQYGGTGMRWGMGGGNGIRIMGSAGRCGRGDTSVILGLPVILGFPMFSVFPVFWGSP